MPNSSKHICMYVCDVCKHHLVKVKEVFSSVHLASSSVHSSCAQACLIYPLAGEARYARYTLYAIRRCVARTCAAEAIVERTQWRAWDALAGSIQGLLEETLLARRARYALDCILRNVPKNKSKYVIDVGTDLLLHLLWVCPQMASEWLLSFPTNHDIRYGQK